VVDCIYSFEFVAHDCYEPGIATDEQNKNPLILYGALTILHQLTDEMVVVKGKMTLESFHHFGTVA
jgi:hypothetical protein